MTFTNTVEIELALQLLDLSDFVDEYNNFPACTEVLTRRVHEAVLGGEFFDSHSFDVAKALLHFFEEVPEITQEEFVGRLALKLPTLFTKTLNGEHPLKNVSKQEQKYILSGLLTEIFISKGIVPVREEVRRFPHYHKVTYLCFGGVEPEKDLLKGYSDEPELLRKYTSGGRRLSKGMKALALDVAETKFKISEAFEPEWVLHGYKLMPEYNKATENESKSKRVYRFERRYAEAWNELAAKPYFHMAPFFDARLRMYYEANQLVGARPQGKLWETLAIDLAEPVMIDCEGYRHLLHIIYTVLHGKYPLDWAFHHISEEDLLAAANADPLSVEIPDLPYEGNERLFDKALNDFGEQILLKKASEAIRCYKEGIPCPFIFGKDLTNSGLIMAGNSFRSEKMVIGANCSDRYTDAVKDSHMQFGKAQQLDTILTRGEIKDIHTPLLHGSSDFTILQKIQEYVSNAEDLTEADVRQHNIEAYGLEVVNIDTIAGWGSLVVDSYVNKLSWKTPDGEVAQHESVMTHTPVTVYSASVRGKKAYHTYNLKASMPLDVDSKGVCPHGKHDGTVVKRRGLFANITHSLDAWCLRKVVKALLANGYGFIMKHDDYMVPPAAFQLVIETLQGCFAGLQETNYYQLALNAIGERIGKPAPKLLTGSMRTDLTVCNNFLMV